MTQSAERPVWLRFAIIFSATFLGCLIALGVLLLAWAYTYYETGGGFVVHVNFLVLGAALLAAAFAAAMTFSKRAKK